MINKSSAITASIFFAAMLSLSAGLAFAVPSVTILSPASGETVFLPNPTFNFQVAGMSNPIICMADLYKANAGGVYSYQGRINYYTSFFAFGSPANLSTSRTTPFTSGQYRWMVTCGGVSSQAVNFSVALPTSPPSLAITTPAYSRNSSPNTMTWNATSTSPVINCSVYINNTQVGDSVAHSSGAFSLTTTAPFADGKYLPYVYCKDMAGGLTVRAKYLTVDTTAPSASFAGVPSAWSSAPATVYATCNDANCMQWDDYFAELNEAPPFPELLAMLYPPFKTLAYSSDPGSCSTNVSLYTGNASPTISSHVWLCAYVVDKAGNSAFSAPVEIKVDTGAPSVVISDQGASPAQSKHMFAHAFDAYTLPTLFMSITTGEVCGSSLPFVPYAPITFTSEGDNGKRGCYKAVDGAGNTAYVLSDAISGIDTTAPAVSVPGGVTAPATGTDGATVIYSASATDAVSGILLPDCAPASGSRFAVGTASVTCSATDEAGNTGTASFNVIVAPLAPIVPIAVVKPGIGAATGTAAIPDEAAATDETAAAPAETAPIESSVDETAKNVAAADETAGISEATDVAAAETAADGATNVEATGVAAETATDGATNVEATKAVATDAVPAESACTVAMEATDGAVAESIGAATSIASANSGVSAEKDATSKVASVAKKQAAVSSAPAE